MKITVIGSGGFEPEPGSDSACILINGKYLVDTGWNSVFKLKEYGHDPCELKAIFLTHLHSDHYLGLPGVLLYIGVRRGRFLKEPLPVTLVGPSEGLLEFTRRVEQFMQWDRFPELTLGVKVRPMQSAETYEDEAMEIRAFALTHTTTLSVPRPISSLGYLFKEKSSKASCAVAWDTTFYPPVAEAVRNADVLFHDIGHSSPVEAAEIAKRAQVGRLFLIHYNGLGEHELAAARQVFPQTFLAREGECVTIGQVGAGNGSGAVGTEGVP